MAISTTVGCGVFFTHPLIQRPSYVVTGEVGVVLLHRVGWKLRTVLLCICSTNLYYNQTYFERELTQLTFNSVVTVLGEESDFQSSRAK